MKEHPGHPWKVDELYTLRATQRARLRHTPDWIIERRLDELNEIADLRADADATLLELELRRRAEDRVGEAEALFKATDRRAGAELLHRFLTKAAVGQQTWKPLMRDEADAAEQRHRDLHLELIPDEQSDDLVATVALMVLAEAVADDDYRDPRLPAWIYERAPR